MIPVGLRKVNVCGRGRIIDLSILNQATGFAYRLFTGFAIGAHLFTEAIIVCLTPLKKTQKYVDAPYLAMASMSG